MTCCKGLWGNHMLIMLPGKFTLQGLALGGVSYTKPLGLGARDDLLGQAYVTVKNFFLTLCFHIGFLK